MTLTSKENSRRSTPRYVIALIIAGIVLFVLVIATLISIGFQPNQGSKQAENYLKSIDYQTAGSVSSYKYGNYWVNFPDTNFQGVKAAYSLKENSAPAIAKKLRQRIVEKGGSCSGIVGGDFNCVSSDGLTINVGLEGTYSGYSQNVETIEISNTKD